MIQIQTVDVFNEQGASCYNWIPYHGVMPARRGGHVHPASSIALKSLCELDDFAHPRDFVPHAVWEA